MRKSVLAVMAVAALMMAMGLAACTSSSGSSSAAASSTSSAIASTSASAASTSASAVASSASATSASASPQASAAPSATSTSAASTEAASASAEASAPAAIAPGAAYGYPGNDAYVFAIYKYLSEEMGKFYGDAEVSLPVVQVFYVDYGNPENMTVFGDFWVFKYNIVGDTLELASGGNCPGVLHLEKDGEAYKVVAFDRTEEGAGFTESAKRLFGDYFNDFSGIHSNDIKRNELRAISVKNYAELNGLAITQYKDPGQDPVKI